MKIYLTEVRNEDDYNSEQILAFSTLHGALCCANYYIQHICKDELGYSPTQDDNSAEFLNENCLETEYTPGGEYLEFGKRIFVHEIDVDNGHNLNGVLEW